ncbi:unnamed protein product [Trichogramma brassicae]|uniref:Uncharacterized protein n=1 Tax=Trichogramma brassicae TaxID=86971 RepID=A0A6H5ITA1_9HYME|nr:unnamed protein product [Trichogramma brassicae]
MAPTARQSYHVYDTLSRISIGRLRTLRILCRTRRRRVAAVRFDHSFLEIESHTPERERGKNRPVAAPLTRVSWSRARHARGYNRKNVIITRVRTRDNTAAKALARAKKRSPPSWPELARRHRGRQLADSRRGIGRGVGLPTIIRVSRPTVDKSRKKSSRIFVSVLCARLGRTMCRLEKLQKLVRNNVNYQTTKEGLTLFRNIRGLLKDLPDAPELQEIFRPEEIDRLLVEALKLYHSLWHKQCGENRVVFNVNEPVLAYFIGYAIHSGYKGEPVLDLDGRPVTRRGTALHEALRCDRLFFRCLIINEIIPDLFTIYQRFDANYVDEDGLTHLHAACRFGRVTMVERFLAAGADPNCRASSTGYTALHFALQTDILADRRDVFNLLLQSGANPNVADAQGRTTLHVLCEEYGDDWFLARWLFHLCRDKYKPVQVNARDNNDNTPLDLARKGEHKDVAKLLLRYGAEPNLTDFPEQTVGRKMAKMFDTIVYCIHMTFEALFVSKRSVTNITLKGLAPIVYCIYYNARSNLESSFRCLVQLLHCILSATRKFSRRIEIILSPVTMLFNDVVTCSAIRRCGNMIVRVYEWKLLCTCLVCN